MKIYNLETKDVYFNLACEEYLFNKYKDEDIFIIWQNEPSVVFGKYQNHIKEINLKYVFDNNIKIARRISGGGCVYHDEGNINYTVITNKTSSVEIDFKNIITPVKDILSTFIKDIYISNRNDLKIGEFKIAGHSQYIRKNRILHHGCILYDSNLENLRNSLKENKYLVVSNCVPSVRSHVKNFKDFLKCDISTNEFKNIFLEKILELYEISTLSKLSQEEIQKINDIKNEKYSLNEYIYGLTPSSKIVLNEIEFEVKNGKVFSVNYSKDKNLEKFLKGCYFNYKEISKELLKQYDKLYCEKILKMVF